MSDGDDAKKLRRNVGFFAMVASDIWNNPKIVSAGTHGALVYIFALTRNAARGRTGAIPVVDLAPAYLARQLGISVDEAEAAGQLCAKVDLLSWDGDEVLIVGWDDSWKRGPLTEAERVRKADYRERQKSQNQKNQRKKERERPDTNKSVRDISRTPQDCGWGPSLSSPLSPVPSKPEAEAASKVIARIHSYTGRHYTGAAETQHVVWLLRKGYLPLHLEALAAYVCDDNGRGWLNKEDSNGSFYMRDKCHPFGVFTEKNVREQLASAVAAVVGGELDAEKLRADLVAFEQAKKAKAS
jgi:hypothetical protein